MVEDTFITEIKEEIGKERLERFFTKFKKPLIALIAFIIIGFSSYEIWKYQTEKARQEAGTKLYNVLSNIDNKLNLETLNEVEANKPFSQLAEFTKAKVLIKEGELDKAVLKYDEVFAKSSNDDAIQDLAKLNATKIIINGNPSSSEIRPNLEQLIDAGRPFRHSALEILAVYELENGNTVEAEKIYQQLVNDGETPASISLRAKDAVRKITLRTSSEE